jgi:hypothetical protein
MTYFDPRKETELWVDRCPVRCSEILIQNGKIVTCGSKAYNSVQTRYFQTERESDCCFHHLAFPFEFIRQEIFFLYIHIREINDLRGMANFDLGAIILTNLVEIY